MPKNRDTVFISYSHKDKKLFGEFKTILAPAIRKGSLQLWDDKKIDPGAQWKEEIAVALSSTKVAVLLVSPNFLESDFIAKRELPPLLKAAQDEGVTIFWVCLSSCLYKETEIANYQAAHDVSRPLDGLSKPDRQTVLTEISEKLLRIVRSDAALGPAPIASKIAVSKLFRSSQQPSALLIGREDEFAQLNAAWDGPGKKNVVTIVA